ncbi:pre-16S rRNA-processing nuclease YqgF [Candidatus Woesebacteria bacterium]|nr:pre-16S rRNA-processing nuclease YqgF [Candidatus Woesebacteria bacterium]
MKYMGIDYGTKRVGIAISDEDASFAFPKAILGSGNKLIEEIVAIATREQVAAIIIGESIASNEVENTVAQKVQAFKAKLAVAAGLPIFFQREDFSSVEAHRYQTTAGNRDDSAAAVILQRFLDKKIK